MSRKKTHEEFIEEFNKNSKNVDKIEILGVYKDAKTKIPCKCKICGHTWDIKPKSLFSVSGCPSCVAKNRKRFVPKTHESFVKELYQINPNIQVVGTYEFSYKHIKCLCKKCNCEWDATPNNLLKGTQCPKCSKNSRTYYNQKSHNQFVNELNIINPNIEILSKYVKSKQKIECQCKICKYTWKATPNSLISSKSGCPQCAQNKKELLSKHISKVSPNRKTTQSFVEEMKIKNPNIRIIGEYVTSKTKIKCQCKICNNIWNPLPNYLIYGNGCPQCGRKKVSLAKVLTHNEFINKIKELNPSYTILDEYVNCRKKISCKCNVCNEIWKATPSKLLSGRSCPVCSGRKCVTGVNDIATKRPDLIKYFVHKEEASEYTVNSSARLLFKCPDCGKEKEMVISSLSNKGFSCNNCNDNISYPNKYLRGFLSQLPIEDIEYEYSPSWAKPYRYDSCFKYKEDIFIIEMDGALGHGNYKFNSKEKDVDGLKRDREKDYLASSNNIKLIRIDCINSDSNYISNNILSSELSNIFDLSNIDWNKCDEFATKNIVKIVCDYYNSHHVSGTKIARELKIGQTTVYRYLKKGTKLGWCNYISVLNSKTA